MSNPKKNAISIAVVVAAIAAGWYFGKQNQPATESVPAVTEAPIQHDHDDHSHDDGHDDGHGHSHATGKAPDAQTDERKGNREKPQTMAVRLQQAINQSNMIREQNNIILSELLSKEEIRAMYKERLNNADLSLYGEDGTRLSEEDYIKKWISDYGEKTPEMIASMEADAQRPIDNFLASQNPTPNTLTDEQRSLQEAAQTPEQKRLEAERIKEDRRKEIDIVRSELLTRNEIEQLYDLKVSEGSSEVINADGSQLPKNDYVQGFINSYGELTPELEAALQKAADRD